MPKDIKCKYCNNLKNHWCETVIDSPDEEMQRDCQYFWQKTNGDRIRAMSDEELKDFLLDKEWDCDAYHCCSVCPRYREGKCVPLLEWLKQPVKEENYG